MIGSAAAKTTSHGFRIVFWTGMGKALSMKRISLSTSSSPTIEPITEPMTEISRGKVR